MITMIRGINYVRIIYENKIIKIESIINFTLITHLVLRDFLVRCKFAKQPRLLIAMFANVWH